jgi:hypothetical protein
VPALAREYLGTTQIYLNPSPEDVIGEFQRKRSTVGVVLTGPSLDGPRH